MLRRRKNVPWIHRYSRYIIGGIAIVGLILTAYLTFSGKNVACTIDAAQSGAGCSSVLDSAYAYPFDPVGKTGPPLSLFGSLAYLGMATFSLAPLLINGDTQKELKNTLEKWSWWLLLAGSFAMATFSSYLMYVLFFKLEGICYYCIGSALFSISLLTLSIIGHEWEDMGQITFTGIIVALITFVGAVGVYANADSPITEVAENGATEIAQGGQIIIPRPDTQPKPPMGWEISTTSGEAEIALAQHLTKIGAVKYGAYWCPHCFDQKQLFGKEAFAEITYIECAPDGKNPQPSVCQAAQIKGFPSWIINNKLYEGTVSLEQLAKISGYTGPTNFKYKLR